MGVVVTFDFASWALRFPEFASLDPALAQLYFNEATAYHRNDGGGPVPTAALQTTYLNLLTAHIAKMNATIAGIAPSGLVGRMSDAQEGSVRVAVEMPATMSAAAAWFTQTTYGFAYWEQTKGYRTARYRARPQFVVGSRWPMVGGW